MDFEETVEREFAALVERVRKINPEAAELLAKRDFPPEANFHPSHRLAFCLVWRETPQGHSFWQTISVKLQEGLGEWEWEEEA